MWVWLPTIADTLPSRKRPIATFSDVASACMSTNTLGARRPGRPTTSPRKRSRMRPSARDVARPGLADHRHLDLSGVRHLLLDLAGDVARESGRVIVRDRSRIDDDADLPPRLHGKGLLDPFEGVAYTLYVLPPLG